MSDLRFECLGAQPEKYAIAPTLVFKLRISELTGQRVHAIALRCQIRIEPQRRRYSAPEAKRLLDIFGETSRWGDTLKPLQFTNQSLMVPGFTDTTEIDLPVQCTYDFDVASAKYFHALEDGEVPFLFLFSGTVFLAGPTGFAVDQVPWDQETSLRMPAHIWRDMMDLHFPNSAWIRVRRDTLDELQRFRSLQALPTWDRTLEMLLWSAAEEIR